VWLSFIAGELLLLTVNCELHHHGATFCDCRNIIDWIGCHDINLAAPKVIELQRPYSGWQLVPAMQTGLRVHCGVHCDAGRSSTKRWPVLTDHRQAIRICTIALAAGDTMGSPHNGRTVTKVLHLIRHGATELHSYMALHRYGGSPHQEPLRADPLM
jgi:hypothetical protein